MCGGLLFVVYKCELCGVDVMVLLVVVVCELCGGC